MQDHQGQLDKEREIYKLKLSEAENKAWDSDQKWNTQMFEFEKEKTKLTIKNDLLNT